MKRQAKITRLQSPRRHWALASAGSIPLFRSLHCSQPQPPASAPRKQPHSSATLRAENTFDLAAGLDTVWSCWRSVSVSVSVSVSLPPCVPLASRVQFRPRPRSLVHFRSGRKGGT
eukprot:3690501-Rhodomonas_salina.1